jgi:hypothetical protein
VNGGCLRRVWPTAIGVVCPSLLLWTAPCRGAEIRWTAPPDCDLRSQVQLQAGKLLGRPLAEVDTVDFELTLAVHGGRWRVDLVSIERARAERRARVLSGGSCAEAADTAAVAISLAIRSTEAEVSSEPVAEELRPRTSPPTPVEEAPSPTAKGDRRQPAPSPPRAEFGAVVSASVLLDVGSLPKPAPGIGVAAAVSWRFLRAAAFGRFFAPEEKEVPRGGGGEFQLILGGVQVCAEQPSGGIRPLGCLGFEVGELSGHGVGVPTEHSGSALWLAANLEAGIAAPLSVMMEQDHLVPSNLCLHGEWLRSAQRLDDTLRWSARRGRLGVRGQPCLPWP